MAVGPNEMLDCQDVENAQVGDLLRPYRKRIADLEACLKRIKDGKTCGSCKRMMRDGYINLDADHSCAAEIAREGLATHE